MSKHHLHLWTVKEHAQTERYFLTESSDVKEALNLFIMAREDEEENKERHKAKKIIVEKIQRERSIEFLGAQKTGKEVLYNAILDELCEDYGLDRRQVESDYIKKLQEEETT